MPNDAAAALALPLARAGLGPSPACPRIALSLQPASGASDVSRPRSTTSRPAAPRPPAISGVRVAVVRDLGYRSAVRGCCSGRAEALAPRPLHAGPSGPGCCSIRRRSLAAPPRQHGRCAEATRPSSSALRIRRGAQGADAISGRNELAMGGPDCERRPRYHAPHASASCVSTPSRSLARRSGRSAIAAASLSRGASVQDGPAVSKRGPRGRPSTLRPARHRPVGRRGR